MSSATSSPIRPEIPFFAEYIPLMFRISMRPWSSRPWQSPPPASAGGTTTGPRTQHSLAIRPHQLSCASYFPAPAPLPDVQSSKRCASVSLPLRARSSVSARSLSEGKPACQKDRSPQNRLSQGDNYHYVGQ